MNIELKSEELHWLLKRVLERIAEVKENPEGPEDVALLSFLVGMRNKFYAAKQHADK